MFSEITRRASFPKAAVSLLSNIRPVVFGVPVSILIATVVMSLVDMDGLLRVSSAINSWILEHFSTFFSWGTFSLVLTSIWAFFSPLGKVTIGGKGAVPILSKWNWFSVTLCTTIAIGILFWGTAEPIFHLHEPPGARGLTPRSHEAAEFAMTSLFMHWSFTPYAIYTVPGLAFALAYHNLGKSFSLSGPLSLVLGKWVRGIGSDIVDAVALFALIAGIAATLGAGMMSLAGGIAKVTGITTSPLLQAGVTVAIVGAFVISSISGLQRGIRVLSDINTKFLLALCLFIFITGPTLFMMSLGWDGLVGYVTEFLPRSTGLGPDHDEAWSRSWTVFYWANWLAWAPITALFLGRIARGYTVRQFILVNLIGPALFAFAWMTVFGGAALSIDMLGDGALKTVLDTGGPEAIAYEVLARYPLNGILILSFLFLTFISYVTAADSNTEAIATVCQKSSADLDTETISAERRQTSLWLKVILASLIGASAWAMTAFTGIDGVRMMSNLGGFPALLIIMVMNVALILLGTRYRAQLTK